MIFFSMTKPADFTECVGDELPVGWEQAYDYHRGGIYYVDHVNRKYQVSMQVLERNFERKSHNFTKDKTKSCNLTNFCGIFFFLNSFVKLHIGKYFDPLSLNIFRTHSRNGSKIRMEDTSGRNVEVLLGLSGN